MATTTKRRGKKRGAKSEAKASTNGSKPRRDLDAEVPAIVKLLKAGTTMTDVRAQYGSGPAIRKALSKAGYNTKGEQVELEKISGSGASLAKKVAAERKNGVAWYTLALRTGKDESVLKELLEEHGHGDLVSGRVVQPKAEKTKTTGKKKTTRKRGKKTEETAADPS